jgi:hypothetical protein
LHDAENVKAFSDPSGSDHDFDKGGKAKIPKIVQVFFPRDRFFDVFS